jgi:hypothetical protein
MGQLQSKSAVARRVYELIVLDCEKQEEHDALRFCYISSFINDFHTLCIQSMVDVFESVMAAAWLELGYEPQGNNCWWEGGFELKAQVLGIKI